MVSRKKVCEKKKLTRQPVCDKFSFLRHVDESVIIWDDAFDGLNYFDDTQMHCRPAGDSAGCEFESSMCGP